VARRPIDIAALALEVVEEQRPSWQGRVVEVEIAALAPGDGDRALVKQVLQNLVENAGKYTRTRDVARIRIFMQAADEGATEPVYVVADNGIGFDMRYADHLFGVFQRLHPAEDYEGTGVGLATVQRIIQRHGGRIWAQARPGQGATFRFTLRPSGAEPAAAGN
jgi:light-regulated signal transduction histidine kinase (bacteriophytochrome)